jgi:hypothetical protein
MQQLLLSHEPLRQNVRPRTKACMCALAARILRKCWLNDLGMGPRPAGERTDTGLDIVRVSGIDPLCDRFCGQHIAHP